MQSRLAFQSGFKRTQLRIFFLVLIGLALLMPAFMLKPAKAQSGTLTINTPSISYGQRLSFSATGLTAGEKVSIWVSDPAGKAYSYGFVNADNLGNVTNFSPAYVVTAGTTGTWSLTIQGLTSSLTGFVNFTLRTPTLDAAAITVGDQIILFLVGGAYWNPGEKVDFWVTGPKGEVIGSFPSIKGHTVRYIWATNLGNLPKSPDDGNLLAVAYVGSAPEFFNITAYGNISKQTVVITLRRTS
jgi:hypothetical protein